MTICHSLVENKGSNERLMA